MRKEQTIQIRVTAEDKQKLEHDASRYGMNISQYLRFLAAQERLNKARELYEKEVGK